MITEVLSRLSLHMQKQTQVKHRHKLNTVEISYYKRPQYQLCPLINIFTNMFTETIYLEVETSLLHLKITDPLPSKTSEPKIHR